MGAMVDSLLHISCCVGAVPGVPGVLGAVRVLCGCCVDRCCVGRCCVDSCCVDRCCVQ